MDSSCLIMVCTTHRTKLCGMPITYVCMLITFLSGSRPLVVPTWDAVFSSCYSNHELKQSPIGGVSEPVRATPFRNVPKKGANRTKKGDFPNLVETAGYIPARKNAKKGCVLTPPPLLILSFANYTLAKKKKLSEWLGGVLGARQTLQILFGIYLSENMGRRRRLKALSPFLSTFLWGWCTPFFKMLLFI